MYSVDLFSPERETYMVKLPKSKDRIVLRIRLVQTQSFGAILLQKLRQNLILEREMLNVSSNLPVGTDLKRFSSNSLTSKTEF